MYNKRIARYCISKRKDKNTITFGQSIEFNIRNIFLQKPCREISSRPLSAFLKTIYRK